MSRNHECLPGFAGETTASTGWSALFVYGVALVLAYAFMAFLLINEVEPMWAMVGALTGGFVAGLVSRRQTRQHSPWTAITGLLQNVQGLALR